MGDPMPRDVRLMVERLRRIGKRPLPAPVWYAGTLNAAPWTTARLALHSTPEPPGRAGSVGG